MPAAGLGANEMDHGEERQYDVSPGTRRHVARNGIASYLDMVFNRDDLGSAASGL
jgi:hypothetical protein